MLLVHAGLAQIHAGVRGVVTAFPGVGVVTRAPTYMNIYLSTSLFDVTFHILFLILLSVTLVLCLFSL